MWAGVERVTHRRNPRPEPRGFAPGAPAPPQIFQGCQTHGKSTSHTSLRSNPCCDIQPRRWCWGLAGRQTFAEAQDTRMRLRHQTYFEEALRSPFSLASHREFQRCCGEKVHSPGRASSLALFSPQVHANHTRRSSVVLTANLR